MPNTAKRKRLLSGLSLIPISLRLASKNITNLMYLVILPNLYLSFGQLYANQVESKAGNFKVVSIFLITSGIAWLIVNQAPIIYFVVKAAQGSSPPLTECYRVGLRYFWQYVVLALGFIVIVGIGLALFILPGLIAAFVILQRYYLTPYYLVDQGMTIKAALNRCNIETKPYFINILDVIFLQITLVLLAAVIGLSSVVIGVGLSTVVAAVSVFFLALRYQEITSKLPSSILTK